MVHGRGKSSYSSDSWDLLASTCSTLKYSNFRECLSWECLYLRLYRNSWWRSSHSSGENISWGFLYCKAVLPWQVLFRKRWLCRKARMGRQAGSGGAAEGEAARRGWQEQPQPHNELAQELGSSRGVLAVFLLAWHCSMWEWKVKLLAATEMESLRHHWCWALKEKCFLSH